MKLKSDIVLHDVGDEHMVIAAGETGKRFHGLLRNNQTADEICRLLQHETTEDAIVTELMKEYEGDREDIARGVRKVIDALRGVGFLDE